MRSFSLLLCGVFALAGCTLADDVDSSGLPVVFPLRETAAVGSANDAADDSAIWIDRSDPAQSRIIGTDKQGGLYVYDLEGRELQFVAAGLVNNVDLRADFPFREGPAPVVVASDRDDQSLAVFRFDPAARALDPVQRAAIPSGLFEVYGVCLFVDRAGAYQAIATSATGGVKQWRISDSAEGIVAEQTRDFDLGSIAEGCVADDRTGILYIGEENVGIWRLAADPAEGDERTLIDTTGGEGHLTADVEGLALYARPDGSGYLVASSQGSSQFAVYDRNGANAYIGSFVISATDGIDGVSGTDGIEVNAISLGPDWPGGILIAQDDENTGPAEPQNFKLVPWAAVEAAIAQMGAQMAAQ